MSYAWVPILRAGLAIGLVVSAGNVGCDAPASAPRETTTGTAQTGSTTTGSGGTSTSSSGGAVGTGGGTSSTGSGGSVTELDTVLAQLRNDPNTTMASLARSRGWPLDLAEGGHLVVSLDPAFDEVAGDFDQWAGVPLNVDTGFSWAVVTASSGDGYKLVDDGTTYASDPWSRAYVYDAFGELSVIEPTAAHLERFFGVSDGTVAPRRVRVWVPAEPVTHLLYAADGQNLFDPDAPWGGWSLPTSLPGGMMVVGIDNTPARMAEYTHVSDDLGGGPIGGDGDDYADFVQLYVRQLVRDQYGEPTKVGVMGSSLGGLISFHIADRYPGAYDFAASLSGTMGWGSIGPGQTQPTMIERYAAAGHRSTALYLDSGGSGTCFDSDQDGIEDDDPSASDNYCENKQLESVLQSAGYTAGVDMWHWHELAAPHNEAAWAARVWRPLAHFAGL